MNLPPYIRVGAGDIILAIKLQPRAAKDEICGPHGNELRVRITAPPINAAANEALVRFLADEFGCPRSCVEIVRGHTSRHKCIRLVGVSAQTVLQAVSRSSNAQ